MKRYAILLLLIPAAGFNTLGKVNDHQRA